MPVDFFTRLGGAVLPLSLIVIMVRQHGPVAKLRKAGASSEETALRLRTAGVQRISMIEPDLESGLVVRTADGRFFVDEAIWKRRRVRNFVVATLIAAALAGVAWILLSR